MERIRKGVVPEEMENKWFIYWEDQTLFFHRSWTGFCIYVVRFVPDRDGWRMVEADVNRDREQYSETSDETDAKTISYLVDVLLLGQRATFPIDDPSAEKQALMMWSLVGNAMFSEGAPEGSKEPEPIELAIPPEVAERLGFYVYLYIDPRTEQVFYVGKGQGTRVLAHLSAQGESRKARILAELAEVGLKPELEVLAHALPSEETALRVEAAVIDVLGLDNLSNLVSGWRSIQFGRMPLGELVTYYAAKPVEIVDPALLIRVNRMYRHGMSERELYDATRSCWKLSKRREKVKYALAVFEGIVREVYEVEAWHPGLTTPDVSGIHGHREPPPPLAEGESPERWEFTGKIAPEPIRSRYFGRSVTAYFSKGSQSPIKYVNC